MRKKTLTMWTFDFEQKCGNVDILKTHPKLLWGTTFLTRNQKQIHDMTSHPGDYFLPNGISQDAQWQRAPSLSRCPGRYLSAVMAADICGLCLKMMSADPGRRKGERARE